jgi:[ribosomal protein S18]-alanine N-acetyltransferase
VNDPLPASIRALQSRDEAEICATWMAASEPWISLRRDFGHALKLLTDPKVEVYSARIEDSFAGFLALDMNGPFAGYIRVVIVSPEFRGHGVGAQLIQFAEKRIFRESPNIFLCVSSFNLRAQALYQRLGYERIGELKDYVIRGASEILMRKSIAPKSDFRPSPAE